MWFLQVFHDDTLQLSETFKDAAVDALAGDLSEEALAEQETGVGVKRRCALSQRFTAGVLWVA